MNNKYFKLLCRLCTVFVLTGLLFSSTAYSSSKKKLFINNITPEAYENLCIAFGVQDIDENTPFYAELMTLLTQERRKDWSMSMERKDGKIDKDQTDVTRDPNLLTVKQEALIADWMKEDGSLVLAVRDFCDDVDIKDWTKLDKKQASALISKLKERREAQTEKAEEPKQKEPKKKKAEKKK